MHYNGIENDMFKQLQLVMNKCDKLSQQLYNIKNEHKKEIKIIKDNFAIQKIHLENRLLDLEKENKILKQQNSKLENEVDRLKKQINNDSNNSSKPPSSDIKPNIPNNRQKSNNKVGGQLGHKPHFLSKKLVEEKISSGEFEHEIIDVGNISDNYISKYIIDIKVSVIAKEYRFYIDDNGRYNIPKEFKTDVRYGSQLKTLCSVLNTEGIVAIDRLTDFVKSITHDRLSISNGTIVNFISSLSDKCKPVISKITTNILNAERLQTDSTGSRCDNKNMFVRNYSTLKDTLLVATKGKGKKYIEETNILPRFLGDLIHDHETVIYRYGRYHGECNVHVTRYLTGCFENTKNNWASSMHSLLCCLNKYKKKLISNNINFIEKAKLENYSLRYDEIIQQGYTENKRVKSKYYRDEEKKLLNRLSKYKKNHLLFIYDFKIPFDNNLSERDLRHVKIKQKVSGYFKSIEGLQNYLNIKSIISTCKKREIDFYNVIQNIFENIPVNL